MSSDLRKSLLFFHVDELKELCTTLQLPNNGTKISLIGRIIHFLETGKIISAPRIPVISKAIKGHFYPLLPNTLMLSGSYKNDLKTRMFFKQLIGEHFHFTAYGIDWLNNRWIIANPPSYQEFATMWQAEHLRRKTNPAAPKDEWAYINFVQLFIKENPTASQQTIHAAWDIERKKQKETAFTIIQKYKTNIY